MAGSLLIDKKTRGGANFIGYIGEPSFTLSLGSVVWSVKRWYVNAQIIYKN